MTTALVSIGPPPAVVAVYDGDNPPNTIAVPGLGNVAGAMIGWGDGGYKLVFVQPFKPPAGQVAFGPPAYVFEDDGSLIESYNTLPLAAPIVSSLTFRHLFTETERQTVTAAGETNPAVRVFMDDAAAAGFVDLGNPVVAQGLAFLVSLSLITKDRAASILTGQPPA